MKSAIRQLALLLVLLSMARVGGRASDARDCGPERNRAIPLGRLRFTPSLLVNSVGVDTNVFNDTTIRNKIRLPRPGSGREPVAGHRDGPG